MNKLGIYDTFYGRYSHGGSIWVYSDPHFNDADLDKYRKITAEEQVKRINSKLGKNDTIIFLGDIGDIELIKKVRGHKILIMGNHDKGASNYKDYFEEVYEGPVFISDKILLSHEPIELGIALNIHGHDHTGSGFRNLMLKDYDADMNAEDLFENQLKTVKKYKLKSINVCAEWVGYMPVTLKSIIQSGVLQNIVDIHRGTIDTATERKSKRKARI